MKRKTTYVRYYIVSTGKTKKQIILNIPVIKRAQETINNERNYEKKKIVPWEIILEKRYHKYMKEGEKQLRFIFNGNMFSCLTA